jgi:hypothetical protein
LISSVPRPDRRAGRARRGHDGDRAAGSACAPAFKRDGTVAAYFRVHDALIAEPTRAVAFAHWTGKVDFALAPAQVPDELLAEDSVRELRHATYAVSCRISDEKSLRMAEELLFTALDRLRSEAGTW